MKEILEQYGNSLLAGMVALLLLGLFIQLPFGEKRGVSAAAGMLFYAGDNRLTGQDNSAYAAYKSIEKPEIRFRDELSLIAGTPVRIDAICQAVDGRGNPVSVQLLSVRDSGGVECECITGQEVCFPEGGIYELRVMACDADGRSQKGVLKVPVMPAGEGEDG